MDSKYETNPLRMWAVVPEEGFLDDVKAVLNDQGHAERWARDLNKVTGCILVVVPVLCSLILVEDTDNG